MFQLDSSTGSQVHAMADQTDNSPSSKGVQFKDDTADKPYPMKHVPTQRYDRTEIRKRLDLETWMDDQLKELYDGQEVSSHNL